MEHVTGQAISSDKEFTPIVLDKQFDRNLDMDDDSLGMIDLTHSTNLEHPCKLVKGNSQPAALSSSNHVLDLVNGRQTFPITATVASLSDARDPFFHDNLTLQPIISPITTNDEILGQDKRKDHFTAGPKNLSSACLKDGKILSKHWGDEDTDTTDGTLEPDTDHEAHKSNCQSSLEHDIDTVGTLANLKETHSADQYLLQHSHEDGFIKPGRKGWKKAANTLNGSSYVRVSTRHKKISVRLKDQA